MSDNNNSHNNLADDYHISANYQQSSILPKVRPNTNSSSGSSNGSRKLPPAAVPATPRMLRNSSGNFQVQPNQQESPSYIPQNYPGEVPFQQTPRRSNSDAHTNKQYGTPPINPQFSTPTTNKASNSRSPARSNLAPINTSRNPTRAPSQRTTPTKLLPPASVNQEKFTEPVSHQPERSPTNSKKHQQSSQFHRRSIGDWDFVKTIGAGSMGKVKLAKHRKTGETCAIKIVPRAAKIYARSHANDPPARDSTEDLARRKEYEKEVARDRRTIREASLGKILYHPFICRLFEVITMSNHFYMLFEYVSGGQMLDYIVSHGSLKERNARKFARGIGSALDYLHKNNVVHRDLKIENIMISKTGDIKIIDFGLSNLYSNDSLLKTYCGSLYFAAPELLSAHPYIGPEVDVWSFGVVLYVLVCGKVPFDDESVGVLHEKIKKGKVEYPETLSPEVVSLLKRMLVVNPNKRARLVEVLSHPWIIKGYESSPVSFIPHRIPLSIPVDAAIIKEMVSLEFGQSEEQVSAELSAIIQSEEYKQAVQSWSSSHDLTSAKTDPTTGFHPLVSIYYLVQEMLTRRHAKESIVDIPSSVPERDATTKQPTTTFPPNNSDSRPRPSDQQTPNLPPTLTFPEAAHTSPVHSSPPPLAPPQIHSSHANANEELMIQQQPHKHRDEQGKGLNSILRKFSQRRANSTRRAPEQTYHQQIQNDDTADPKLQAFDQGFGNDQTQLVQRVGSMKLLSKKPTFEDSTESGVRSHSRTVSAYSGVKKSDAHDLNDTMSNSQRKFHPSARAKSVGHRRDHVALAHEVNQIPPLPTDINDDAYFDDITLDEYLPGSNADKVTLVNSNTSSNRKDRTDYSELNEDLIVKEAAKAPSGTMPSIEYPRTLFLKGFFSVQTTSTKPLPVIRASIISVLSKLGVQFTEVRGGFICVHTPSIEQPLIVVTEDADSHNGGDTSLRSAKSVKSSNESASGAFSTETGRTSEHKTTDDRSSLGDSIDQQQTPGSKAHRRKFSIGGSILGYRRKQSGTAPPIPNTPVATTNANQISASPSARNYTGHDFDSSASLDSLNNVEGGSDMLISSRIEQNRVQAPTTITEDHNAISALTDDVLPGSAKISSAQSRTPLKFEIHIVKVPLVGLFGVHFKKVTGNTWLYKALAGQILNELNL